MDTSRRIASVAGVILFLTGCITCLYLVTLIFNAQLYGIFFGLVTESPTQEFRDLRCPRMVSKSKTVPVVVSIHNPTTPSLGYRIWIEPHGFFVRSPEKELRIIAPGGQTTEITWSVTAVEQGNQAIAVDARSDRDLANPNAPFYTWPTSFRDFCGILVTDNPWMGTWGAGLSLASLVVGAALTFPWLYARIRARSKGKKPKYRFRWWALMALVLGMAALFLATVIEDAIYGYRSQSISIDFEAWKRLLGEPPRLDFEAWERSKRWVSWEDVDFEAWERRVYGNNLNF
jgi:hypothetical protein